MKFSATIALSLAVSSRAFVPTSQIRSHSFLSVTSEPEVAEDQKIAAALKQLQKKVEAEQSEEEAPAVTQEAVVVEEAAPVATETSVASPAATTPTIRARFADTERSNFLPFLPRPTNLDGTHAGDFGFDPLGLSQSNDLYVMQEAEARHGRLAMLAVVGWPAAELLGPDWLLQDGGRAPSVLNGVNPITGFAILASFAALGWFEYQTALRRTTDTPLGRLHQQDMGHVWQYGVAGDYNFDPLNLYDSLGNDPNGRFALRQVEVVNGRFAMLAISFFALAESITGRAIVDNNPFFHPNWELPLLVVGYLAWSQIYQVSNLTEYPVQIEYTKDGEERERRLRESSEALQADMAVAMEQAAKVAAQVDEKLENSGVYASIEKAMEESGLKQSVEETKAALQEKIDEVTSKVSQKSE